MRGGRLIIAPTGIIRGRLIIAPTGIIYYSFYLVSYHWVVDVGDDAVTEGGLAVLGFAGFDHLPEDVLVADQDQQFFGPGDGGVKQLAV